MTKKYMGLSFSTSSNFLFFPCDVYHPHTSTQSRNFGDTFFKSPKWVLLVLLLFYLMLILFSILVQVLPLIHSNWLDKYPIIFLFTSLNIFLMYFWSSNGCHHWFSHMLNRKILCKIFQFLVIISSYHSFFMFNVCSFGSRSPFSFIVPRPCDNT